MNGYPTTIQLQGSSTAGEAIVLYVPCSDLGFVNRLVVKQTSGTNSGFTVDLYDREEAAKNIAEINYGIDDRQLLDAETHKVIPQQSAGSGVASISVFGGGYAFQNIDEKTAKHGMPPSGLWLVIDPAGTGASTFDVAITVVYPTKR